MPIIMGYQAMRHLPVTTEGWVNDVWLVPVAFEEYLREQITSDVGTLLEHQDPATVLNGYKEHFVDTGRFFPISRAAGRTVPPAWYIEVEKKAVDPIWLGDDVLITEAKVYPLWQLRDTDDAENQGIDPRDVPHTFDYGDILDMPGADFQGEQIEPDRGTERVEIELLEGWVALRHLRQYLNSLRLGRVRVAWILNWQNRIPQENDLSRGYRLWGNLFATLTAESGPPHRSFGHPPMGFDKRVEVPFSLGLVETVLEKLVRRQTRGWKIDATPPRNVLFPPGTRFPDAWTAERPEGY